MASSSTTTPVSENFNPPPAINAPDQQKLTDAMKRYKTSLLEAVVIKEQLSIADALVITETRKLETANDSARLAKMEMDSINAQYGTVDGKSDAT